MGMYTEFHFNSMLKEDVPIEIVDVLRYMVGEYDNCPPCLPNHKLFGCERWSGMLRCDSYYFDADTHSTLKWDNISKSYYLCIRCNFKNYDDEIENFVDFIKPYLEKEQGSFLGFSRYEEREVPTLIYM